MRQERLDELKSQNQASRLADATLGIEALCGQAKAMADGARFVRDLDPPLGTISKPCDGIADQVRVGHCSLIPCDVLIR
jgi:hypothetical protein